MNCNKSPLFGSNQTNSGQCLRFNTPYNCCETSINDMIMNSTTNTTNNSKTNTFEDLCINTSKWNQNSFPSLKTYRHNNSVNNNRDQSNQYMNSCPIYPPMYSTSNWSSNRSPSYGPTYTFANPSLITNTTNSQSVPTSSSSAFYTPSKMSRNESTIVSNDCNENCNKSKEEFKQLIDCLDNIRKNNEEFQSKLLNEVKQLKEVMIDLKLATNEMPHKFSDALNSSLASIQSRSNSISIESDTELVDILDSIEISKEDEEISHSSNGIDLSQLEIIETEKKETNDKNSSTIDRFIFPYDSTLDMNKWLKKD